jgi:hypothetical protein
MTVLVATSVVRGSHQGESHGGVYLIDLKARRVTQPIDWNTANIDWQGRGWDRGLRGIAFDGERVFIAASDELFAYTPTFELLDSYRCAYLKHCHEIAVFERRLFLTSTGFDAILGFDLDANRFSFGLQVHRELDGLGGTPFDPECPNGPAPTNTLHLNSVTCDQRGMFLAGLRTGGLLVYTGRKFFLRASMPDGIHNAMPHRDGVLFNDSNADAVRFVTPNGHRSFHVPRYEAAQLTHTDLGDSRIARQAFGRGLCVLDENRVAAGSSPSTIAIHDLEALKTTQIVTLTYDIRNAIHGLEVWPFDPP